MKGFYFIIILFVLGFGFSPLSGQESGRPNLVGTLEGARIQLNGSELKIAQEIQQVGTRKSTSSYLGYFLSADPEFSNEDYFLGFDNVRPLMSGQVSLEVFSIDIATLNLDLGSYYIITIVDYLGRVPESNEHDNIYIYSEPIKIEEFFEECQGSISRIISIPFKRKEITAALNP